MINTPTLRRPVPLDLTALRAGWPSLTFFTDISDHQEVTDWTAFAAASPAVIVKVSEGVHYTDPRFNDPKRPGTHQHWNNARRAGQLRAPYHYAHIAWKGNATDPIKAVEAFWERIAADPGELSPVLDLEKKTTRAALAAGMKPAQIVRWITAWLDWVERARGLRPWIYNHHGIVEMLGTAALPLREWPQWMAAYPGRLRWSDAGPSQPYKQPANWPWCGWQFTSSGRAPGVIGRIDLNVARPGSAIEAAIEAAIAAAGQERCAR